MKLILLKTTDKTNIILGDNLLINISGAFRGSNYHLYVIDESAEIKEGDNIILNGNLNKCLGRTKNNSKHLTDWQKTSKAFKIIASTQQLEGIPQLSKSSIKLAIDYINRTGEKEVEVKIIKHYLNVYDDFDSESKETFFIEDIVDIAIPEEKMFSLDEISKLFVGEGKEGGYFDDFLDYRLETKNKITFKEWFNNFKSK